MTRRFHFWLALTFVVAGSVGAQEEVLFEETFDGDLNDWLFEGPGGISIRDGALLMEVPDERPKSAVTWCTKQFEGPVRVSYDFRPLVEGTNPNSSCIFMAYATPTKHESILDWERDGSYGVYAWSHTMAVYSISYKRRPDKGEDFRRCNVRLLGGNTPEEWSDGVGGQDTEEWQTWNRLTMLGTGRDDTDYLDGEWHHIEVSLEPKGEGTTITMKVDGVVTLTCVDRGSEVGGPLNGGWFGFRQFGGAQRCLYDNFRVTRLGE